jgi:hypothetical protein
VTSVVIRLALLRPGRGRSQSIAREAALRWRRGAGNYANCGPRPGGVENARQIRPTAIEEAAARRGDGPLQFRRRIGGKNQRAVEIEPLQLRMQRDQILDSARSVENREAHRQKSRKLCDANCLDYIGILGSVDTRAGKTERKTQSRRRLKLVNPTPKQFSVGLQEDFAPRGSDRIRELRNLRMLKRLGPANPNERRREIDPRQRTSNSRIDGLKIQNQRTAATGAQDASGDSKLEVRSKPDGKPHRGSRIRCAA